MSRIKKVDSNQASLVKQMRKIPGLSVLHIHTVGKGCPDLALGWNGRTILAEVKDPSKPPSQRRLTEDEEKFFAEWTGEAHIIETIDDVLKIINP
jgi:hypothetical protein